MRDERGNNFPVTAVLGGLGRWVGCVFGVQYCQYLNCTGIPKLSWHLQWVKSTALAPVKPDRVAL